MLKKTRKSCNIEIYGLANYCIQINKIPRLNKYVEEWVIAHCNGIIAIIESLYQSLLSSLLQKYMTTRVGTI